VDTFFQQDAAAEIVLSGRDPAHHQVQRFFGERQRQQIVEMAIVHRAPAQVFGHQRGLDALDQALEPGEMFQVQPVAAAE